MSIEVKKVQLSYCRNLPVGGPNEVGFKGFSHQTVTCLIGKIETSDSYREIKAFKNFQKFNCINTGIVYLYKLGYLLM